MKPNDKVRIKSSPYTMFEVGSEYTISYVDDRPYGVYLVDPFYENSDGANSGQWPFHRDEVELVVCKDCLAVQEAEQNPFTECDPCGWANQ